MPSNIRQPGDFTKCLDELLCDVNNLVEDFLDGAVAISREDVIKRTSLDPRAFATRIWAGEDFIAVDKYATGSLDYYGGFEYVNKDEKTTIGSYVFYSADNSRVQDLLDDLSDLTDRPMDDEYDEDEAGS